MHLRAPLDKYTHGTDSSYQHGCRCDPCREAHNRAAVERRKRRAYGRLSPHDRLPCEPTIADLGAMRALGLNWRQIAEACGTADRTLTNIYFGHQEKVSVLMAANVRRARERAERAGEEAATRGAMLVDAAMTQWMITALHARGWPRSWIAQNLGVQSFNVSRQKRVHIDTRTAIEALFLAHHDQWGPLKRTALDAWRRGHFPSDCYMWEDGDLRPIPGSLHTDLVAESLTYFNGKRDRQRKTETRRRMREWGQFAEPQCARAVALLWMEHQGIDTEDCLSDGGYVCRAKHGHELPEFWLDDEHPMRTSGLEWLVPRKQVGNP